MTWHKTYRTSWWDGTATAWCGVTLRSGQYETNTWYIGTPGGKCPACETAKRRAGK